MTPQKWKTNDKTHEGLKLPHLRCTQRNKAESSGGGGLSCRETVSPWEYRAGEPSTPTSWSLHSRAQNPQSYTERLENGVKKWSKGRKGISAMPPSLQSGRNSNPTGQSRNPQFTRTLFSGPLGNMRKTWQVMVIFATLIVLMVLWFWWFYAFYVKNLPGYII